MSAESDVDKAARTTAGNIFRPGITPEEVQAGYDDWSKNYDEVLMNSQYRAPAIALEEILQQVPPEKRPQMKVLDVAAGTGWVGRDLHREGFRLIDAVEPSEGMIKKLRETGIYTKDFMEFIGTGHSTVPNDTYDLVVISGGMGEGHIPVSGLDDLVRVAKDGGLVVISMRLEFLETVSAYKDKLEPYMDDLEEDGKWRKMFGTGCYRGPAIVVEEALRRVPPERRAKARVLDVAAGTGWLGQDLRREGFRHLDAVEPSQGMVKKLRESGVYTHVFMEFIGSGCSTVPEDTYDLVVISGGMGEGHIPVSGLDDLVRVAKDGGFVVNVMRLEYLESAPSYKDKLEPYMEHLEEGGKWRKVERCVVPNYFFEMEGLVYVHRVTKAG